MNETFVIAFELKIKNSFGGEHLSAIYNNCKKLKHKKINLNIENNIIIIKIELYYNNNSLAKLFKDCDFFEELKYTEFEGKNITDMSGMFSGCKGLIKVDLSKFKTDNVTDMSHLLHGCSSLKEFKHNFNTSNVENMSHMFYDCSSLEQISISNFDTKKVTNMSYMFGKCKKLKELSLLLFKTGNVENMSYMFCECSSLEELNLKTFNINKLIDRSYMGHMFENCEQLKDLIFPALKLKSNDEKNTLCIFHNCKNLNTDNFVENENEKETDIQSDFDKEGEDLWYPYEKKLIEERESHFYSLIQNHEITDKTISTKDN